MRRFNKEQAKRRLLGLPLLPVKIPEYDKVYNEDGTVRYTTPRYTAAGWTAFAINRAYWESEPGTSVVGHHIKYKTTPVIPVLEQVKDHLVAFKKALKPKLPK